MGDAGLERVPAAVLGRVGPLYLFPPFPSLLPSAATDSRGQGGTVMYMGAWPAVGHGQSGWLCGAMAGLKEGSVCGKQSGQGDQQQSSCLGRGGELAGQGWWQQWGWGQSPGLRERERGIMCMHT